MNKLLSFAIDSPKKVFVALILSIVVLLSLGTNLVIDTDPENMLPEDNSARVLHNEIKKRFNIHDLIVVGVVNNKNSDGIYNPQTLSKIHTLNTAIEKIDGVIRQDILSLPSSDNVTQSENNTLLFQWLMKEPPKSKIEALQLKNYVDRLPLAVNTLVSGDDKAAAIYVPITAKKEAYRISQEIQATIDSFGQSENGDKFYFTGVPVAQDTFGIEMFQEMAVAVPVTSILLLLMMFVFFRSTALVNGPVLMAHAVVMVTMGLLVATGNTVAIMSSLIPIFLIPISIVDSVHVLSEFSDKYKPGEDVKKRIHKTISGLFKPMLYTSLTSAAGFASLVFTPIPPIQIFGLFVAFGIMLAFLLTITFIPAYIVSMKEEKLIKMAESRKTSANSTVIGRFVRGLGKKVVAMPLLISVVMGGVLVFSVYGIQLIQVNDNPVHQFGPSHKIRIADRVLNEHFSGTYNAFMVLNKAVSLKDKDEYFHEIKQITYSDNNLSILWGKLEKASTSEDFNETLKNILVNIENPQYQLNDHYAKSRLYEVTEKHLSKLNYFTEPSALAYIENLQEGLMESGLIGKINSLPDLVKTVARELRSGEDQDFSIPDSRQGVRQTLLSFQSSHRPHDLWKMVTPDYQSSALWMQLKTGDNQDMEKVLDYVDQYLAENPLPEGVSVEWGGLTYLNVIWQNAMVNGMLDSLKTAYVVVFFMMILLFRSVLLSVVAMIPLSITILCIYGAVGLTGKNYDAPVAILSSLVLGLTIDFAIHFIERARSLYNQGKSWPEVMSEMFEEPARAIFRNALVVSLGFAPLLISVLTPYQTVGMFLASIMLLSALVTLIVLPHVMIRLPKWVFTQSLNNDFSRAAKSTEDAL